MATAVRGLSKIQIGVEVTRGTLVAATRRLLMKNGTYGRIEDFEEHEDEMQGTLARVVSAPTLTRQGTTFEFTNSLDFTQILLALEAGVKGGVAPTQPGGAGPAELWVYTPSMTADPEPKAFTAEYADIEGGNEESYESSYGICTGFGIGFGEEGVAELTMNLEARASKVAASTAALAVPSGLFYAPVASTKLYIDSSWANLGTTLVSGQLYNGNFTWADFIRAERYHEGRVDLDFSNYEYSAGRKGDLEFDVVVNPDSGLVPAERAFKSTKTMRFVRLEWTGPAFANPDEAYNHFVRIDMAAYHRADSLAERGGDRNGSNTGHVHLTSAYDPTQAQDIEFSVQNTAAAFP